MHKTLITIPTFNEAENIGRLVESLLAIRDNIDVLVVDDSSPDGTAEIVESLIPKYIDRLFVLRRQKKNGRGQAVLDGFRFGLTKNYALFIEMDADLSHNPGEIPSLLGKMEEGYDMVLGSRYLPGSEIHGWSKKRRIFSRCANFYARHMLRVPISDYTNGYRCYARSAVEVLDMENIESKGYVVLSEVAYQLHTKGKRIGEVPTVFLNRVRGTSNLTWNEIQEAFLSVMRIRWKSAHASQKKRA
jgi:dolichol-phosphate mannosyltransferase